jgi:hypothetical protein
MRHIRDIYDRLELVACVAIAACSPTVPQLPTWNKMPTSTEWAEHIVKHVDALRKTLRWAWAARVEE